MKTDPNNVSVSSMFIVVIQCVTLVDMDFQQGSNGEGIYLIDLSAKDNFNGYKRLLE
jgi:hypothetical protein